MSGFLSDDLWKCILEWAFDPEVSAGLPEEPTSWVSHRWILSPGATCSFLWRYYVEGRCKLYPCPCAVRAECILDVALNEFRRSSLTPWRLQLSMLLKTKPSHQSEKLWCVSRMFQLEDKKNGILMFSKLGSLGCVPGMNYLMHTWQLTGADICSIIHMIIQKAAENGHANVLEFLFTEFDANAQEVRWDNNRALQLAAKSGHVDVLECLHRIWGLNSHDAQARHNQAYRLALANGHVEVLSFLKNTWNIS